MLKVWCFQGRQRLTWTCIYYVCRFTCHPCVKRYEHKSKAHTHNAFTCTVNIHVDVKAHPQRSGSAPEGCRIFIPFTPHGYLPTLLQAIHSPEGTKESISVSFSSWKQTFHVMWTMPIRKCGSRDQSLEGGGGGVWGGTVWNRSSRSTFDLARFTKNTDHVDNTCYENTDHVIIHWSRRGGVWGGAVWNIRVVQPLTLPYFC